MRINQTTNDINFNGQMIVIGHRSRPKLKKIARQVNNMRAVKYGEYNIYIAKTNKIFKGLPVVVSAQRGKPDISKLVFDSIRTVPHPDAIIGATKRAIAKTKAEEISGKLTFKQKLFKFFNNITSGFLKFFRTSEK